jgi:divalent metal cation (Fe/Co/Zn/Cd) transporter
VVDNTTDGDSHPASCSVFFVAVRIPRLPLGDPLVGLVITLVILRIAWGSGKEVFTRAIDGVDPAIPDEIGDASCTPKASRTL